jgi:hypothetical protein
VTAGFLAALFVAVRTHRLDRTLSFSDSALTRLVRSIIIPSRPRCKTKRDDARGRPTVHGASVRLRKSDRAPMRFQFRRRPLRPHLSFSTSFLIAATHISAAYEAAQPPPRVLSLVGDLSPTSNSRRTRAQLLSSTICQHLSFSISFLSHATRHSAA